MARASTPTQLPLDTFARIFGINPIHFSGARADNFASFRGACQEVWPQYSWQSHHLVSREDVAYEVQIAEQEVAAQIGFLIGPGWVSDEVHSWPRQANGYVDPSFKLRYGKLISGGRRASSLIDGDVVPVYSDADGDSFEELATITVTTDVDPDEVRVFFQGHTDNPAWEIRPAIARRTVGNTVVLTFDSWLFIDPDLWELATTVSEDTAIDITTDANFVVLVDVYRVYNDTTQPHATVYWGNHSTCLSCFGAGCPVCSPYSQSGCIVPVNSAIGTAKPFPGTYSVTDDAWQLAIPTGLGRPTSAHFWYYSGDASDEYSRGFADVPIRPLLAQSVAQIAASRLQKPFCSCGNVQETINYLRRDIIMGTRDGFANLPSNSMVHSNPFGTRMGEVMAWRTISSLVPDSIMGAGVL